MTSKSPAPSNNNNNNPNQKLPTIVIASEVDGRKFRMILKGALEKLSVTKIKHYLEQSTKIPSARQVLQFHGATLDNHLVGADFGLHPDAVLHVNDSELMYGGNQNEENNIMSREEEIDNNNNNHDSEPLNQFHSSNNNNYQFDPQYNQQNNNNNVASLAPSYPLRAAPLFPSQQQQQQQQPGMSVAENHNVYNNHTETTNTNPSVNANTSNHPTSKRITEELAAIRSSLDQDKKKNQQQQHYFSSSYSHNNNNNNGENIRPSATPEHPKNTVHSSISEPIRNQYNAIPESLAIASNRGTGPQHFSPPRTNNTNQLQNTMMMTMNNNNNNNNLMTASSPLSGMQISSSMLATENTQLKTELDKFKGKVQALEAALQAQHHSSNGNFNGSTSPTTAMTTTYDGGFPPGGVLASARVQLAGLSQELGLDLAFDESFSCAIGSDDATVLITVDPATERLYLYSTLLDSLDDPKVYDDRKRARIYRALLEWAMLGRDMAGGGVGVDATSGVVIMSTSIDLKNSRPPALRDTAPVFVESLTRWRQALNTLINS